MTLSVNVARASEIAVSALAFLAADKNKLNRFVALTGIAPDDMRSAAVEPGFLAGVLEFFMGHEPDLLELASALELKPEEIAAAHFSLNSPNPQW